MSETAPSKATAIAEHPPDAAQEIAALRAQLADAERQRDELQAALEAQKALATAQASHCDRVPSGCLSIDRKGRLLFGNARALTLLGIRSGKVPQRTLGSFFADDAALTLTRFLAQMFAGASSPQCELTLPGNRRRSPRVLLAQGHAGPSSKIAHLSLIDISDAKRLQQRERLRSDALELLANGSSLKRILETITLGIEAGDIDARACVMLLDPRGEHLSVAAAPRLPAEFLAAIDGLEVGVGQGCCGTAAFTGKCVVVESVQQHPYCRRWREVAAAAGIAASCAQPITGSNGQMLGAFAVYHDTVRRPSADDLLRMEEAAQLISIAIERHRAREALRESEERWKFAVEGAGDGIWDWDARSGNIVVSSRWYEIFGLPAGSFTNVLAEWRRRVHRQDLRQIMATLQSCLDGRTNSHAIEYRLRANDGCWRWALARGLVVSRDENGRPLRMIGTQTDISQRRRMEEELRALATTDDLSGLANRRRFMERLEEEHARLQRDATLAAAVLMIDIDHFKKVNDRFGHATGDAMICHFADLLRSQLRRLDTAGRLGGEEFAVLLSGATLASAHSFAKRLRRVVEDAPLGVKGEKVPLTISIGLTVLSAEHTHPENALARADQALYQAKAGGRNRVVIAP
ncbi:diguanylate cyclase [Rhodocyclus tenuis]|uniref:Diguanylate cyclase n=1 Tax=Rhodocyclus gracilis TaxID=2929842 RepID=A0ABX0WIC6_9RHOO|nr:diguanylate cyclase [Rhodocyclus gracilis]NJA89474.1 diguanylate cyclase [Rhodocyclus gracilis]